MYIVSQVAGNCERKWTQIVAAQEERTARKEIVASADEGNVQKSTKTKWSLSLIYSGY